MLGLFPPALQSTEGPELVSSQFQLQQHEKPHPGMDGLLRQVSGGVSCRTGNPVTSNLRLRKEEKKQWNRKGGE
jgi:hypothetical protein